MKQALSRLRQCSQLADLIEVRIDGISDLHLEKLLKRPRPAVIITNRRKEEGGQFTGSAKEQFDILSKAINLGAEYVDIEMSWGTEFVKKILSDPRKTRVICSYHNFKQTPSNLLSIYEKMKETGADVIKIATMTSDITDNVKMFKLLNKARKERQRLIAFCMGESGQISRILTAKFGGYLTYAAQDIQEFTGPGQLTLDDLTNIYRIHTLDTRTKVLGLAGNPVTHSKGIYYHNRVFARRAVNAVYLNFLVTNLNRFVRTFREYFTGLSITMPFKQEVIPLLDTIDEKASSLNVVNTVIFKNGKLIGYNTDLPAIERLLRKRTILKDKNVVVLGTGATSKTMAFVSVTNGAQTIVVGRSAEKAKAMAVELHCDWGTFKDFPTVKADIIMNGTSVGMTTLTASDQKRLVPKDYLHKGMIVLDAVYNPPLTPFLKSAQQAGCEVISGVELFEEQARIQSKLFLEVL
ncbi:MAG: type I 3-dehydroquinate dehydratase [Ignavibacteriae bacterium]|nr:type I 3-dehydroquinate dehydratase [Ignavibacteriota bacterium]